MPLNNLRSVTALLCRNFSTGSRRNLSSSRRSYVSKGSRFLTRASGFTLGVGVGYLILGDGVSKAELHRKKLLKDWWWYPVETEDLREKMWPELREKKKWFQDMINMWSELRDQMFSGPKS